MQKPAIHGGLFYGQKSAKPPTPPIKKGRITGLQCGEQVD